jgi:hypothetical protein
MKSRPQALSIVAVSVAVASIAVGACVIPIGGAEVGDLRVTWSFEGSQRCSQVGVDDVTVQLIEKGKEGQGALAFGQTAPCVEGSMLIPDVVAGTYVMTVTGEGDVAVFNNGDGLDVVVAPNDETSVDAPLVLANGEVVSRIEFQFSFPGGRACNEVGIATINAQVIDENGIGIAGSATECLAGLAAIEGIRIGEHTLRVEAVDADDNVRFVGVRQLTGLQAGETLRIDPVQLDARLSLVSARYTFGGLDSCARAGVATVDAQLIDAEDGIVVDGQNVACIGGRVDFVDVPVGNYRLRLDGLDGDGLVQFTADVEELTIDDIEEDLGVFDLDPLSSTVVVRFALPAGETCATLGVANIDLRIVDADGGTTGQTVACVAGEATLLGPAPGNATVFAEGVAGEDVVVAGTRAAILTAGRNPPLVLNLQPTRTQLEVRWDFTLFEDPNVTVDDDEITRVSSSCIEADVDTILVRVLRGIGQNAVLLEAVEVGCTLGRVEIPNILIQGGNVRLEVEGLRQQEGDSIFFAERSNIAVNAVRTSAAVRLAPSIVFARVIWTGDCGVVGSNTVDIQVSANGVSEGINIACATGNTFVVLPPGTEDSLVTISLRGVDGQGDPRPQRQTIQSVSVEPGIATFRFTGPL